jgi:hypothetical protein
MENIIKDVDVHQSTVKMATVALGDAAELAVFVAPFDCFLNKIYFTNDAGITGDDTNYSTLSFQRKGSAGSGTDEIASHALTTGNDVVAKVPLDVGALGIDNRYIPKGTAVTYKKAVTGNGLAFTDPLFTVEYTRA